ncbi:uncharacterized protein METZ01_LOCUS429485, partial [marine metagenome]
LGQDPPFEAAGSVYLQGSGIGDSPILERHGALLPQGQVQGARGEPGRSGDLGGSGESGGGSPKKAWSAPHGNRRHTLRRAAATAWKRPFRRQRKTASGFRAGGGIAGEILGSLGEADHGVARPRYHFRPRLFQWRSGDGRGALRSRGRLVWARPVSAVRPRHEGNVGHAPASRMEGRQGQTGSPNRHFRGARPHDLQRQQETGCGLGVHRFRDEGSRRQRRTFPAGEQLSRLQAGLEGQAPPEEARVLRPVHGETPHRTGEGNSSR